MTEGSVIEAPPLGPPCIVVAGNPSDGFLYYGPFEWAADAVDWASENVDHGGADPWWVVDLMDPTEGQDASA